MVCNKAKVSHSGVQKSDINVMYTIWNYVKNIG